MKWLAVLLLLIPALSEGATINAATCNLPDVRTAINTAADGDTVQLPTCSVTWTEPLDSLPFGAPYDGTLLNRCLTIAGNGAANTIITDGLTTIGDGIRITMFRWRMNSTTCVVRLTGISFVSSVTHANNDGLVEINGQSHSMRVDHIQITTGGTSGLMFYGGIQGVVDHNTFILAGAAGFGSYTFHNDWTGTGDIYGDHSWASGETWGGSQQIFYENNTCTLSGGLNWCWDGWQGMRRTERFNTSTNLEFADHGTESSGRYRGIYQREAYNNTFTMTNHDHASVIDTRGGSTRVFNNTATTSGAGTISGALFDMETQRVFGSFAPWGQCNGASTWDQNAGVGGAPGYACLDQVGRTTGDLITGDTPINSATGTAVWPREILSPTYTWGNTVNGANSPAKSNEPAYIVADRDFYTQGASFDGTSGVGVGTIASRPATCTTGVAYWVTDRGKWRTDTPGVADGRLDKCTATNTWSVAFYMPYCYPHPTVSGTACTKDPNFGGSAPAVPNPPSNASIH